MTTPKVLFVCVHNSGRSQMAEAIFNTMAQGQAVAESAGTMPAGEIAPAVREVLREIEVSLEGHYSKVITQEQVDRADRAFTMGCAIDEACPAQFIPAEDWGLEDPKGQPIEKVREVRDQIVQRVTALLEDMGSPTHP